MGKRAREEEIEKIQAAFAEFRGKSKKRQGSYPEGVRRLAVEALARGHSLTAVGRAAGVSGQAVSNWRGDTARHLAQQLTLVDEEPAAAAHAQRDSRAQEARILFGGGVVIELPLSGLTRELIAALSGEGGAP